MEPDVIEQLVRVKIIATVIKRDLYKFFIKCVMIYLFKCLSYDVSVFLRTFHLNVALQQSFGMWLFGELFT